MFGKRPPGYREAKCCHNCTYGNGSGVNPGWYCSFFGGMRSTDKHGLCDEYAPYDGAEE